MGAERFKILDGQGLLVEDQAELAGGAVGDGLEAGQCARVSNFAGEACDGPIGNAAGIDELEVAEIRGDVESESVRGDAACDVNADGSDLPLPCRRVFGRSRTTLIQKAVVRRTAPPQVAPDAGEAADTTRCDAEFAAEPDERFFDEANEVDGAEAGAAWVAQAAQIEDRVTDELAWAVVGYIAATVDFVERDSASRENFIRREDVGAPGVAAEGEDGGVFKEQKSIGDEVAGAELDELDLEAQGLGVVDTTEIEVLDHQMI
jgi:hypothetical protein